MQRAKRIAGQSQSFLEHIPVRPAPPPPPVYKGAAAAAAAAAALHNNNTAGSGGVVGVGREGPSTHASRPRTQFITEFNTTNAPSSAHAHLHALLDSPPRDETLVIPGSTHFPSSTHVPGGGGHTQLHGNQHGHGGVGSLGIREALPRSADPAVEGPTLLPVAARQALAQEALAQYTYGRNVGDELWEGVGGRSEGEE